MNGRALKWKIARLESKISNLEAEKKKLKKALRVRGRERGTIYIQR